MMPKRRFPSILPLATRHVAAPRDQRDGASTAKDERTERSTMNFGGSARPGRVLVMPWS